jgi:hypothetical protein
MATPNAFAAPSRSSKRPVQNPAESGLPDPRPVTDYTVTLGVVSGHSRLTVVLSQPCAIRQPMWPLVNCMGGTLIAPTGCTVVSNTAFQLDFAGVVPESVAFVQVPYQDMNVQNFRGGFVIPGGRWFRDPVMPG